MTMQSCGMEGREFLRPVPESVRTLASKRADHPTLTISCLKTAQTAPHERILATAREMFCRDGIHATGIDRILAGAGASKMTLYAHFGSKQALLQEVLVQEGAEWRRLFFAALDGPAPLTRTVIALETIYDQRPFYGCAFMNAVAEHAKGEPWLRALAAAHHQEILAVLEGHAAGRPAPALLARQLLLLLDGAIAALMVSGDRAVFTVAERTLAAILRDG